MVVLELYLYMLMTKPFLLKKKIFYREIKKNDTLVLIARCTQNSLAVFITVDIQIAFAESIVTFIILIRHNTKLQTHTALSLLMK